MTTAMNLSPTDRKRSTFMPRSDFQESRKVAQHLRGEHLWSDNIPIGMAVLTEKNEILRVNRALCRFLGYSKRELLGKTARDITHPDEWKNSATMVRKLYASGQPYSRFEKRFLHKSGKTLWGEVNSSLIDDKSRKPNYRITQIVDITERKEAEAALRLSHDRFRVALSGSPTVVFSQDRRLRYTWAYNPSPCFKIGDIIGKRDIDLYESRDAKQFMRIKKEVMRTGASRRDEVVTHFPNGEMTHDMISEPLRDEQGKIVGVICAAIDITQRKRLESALQKANEELEKKVKDRTHQLKKLTEELIRAEHMERRRIADILHEQLQQHLCGMKFRAHHLKEGSAVSATICLADKLINELDQAIHLTRTLSSNLYPQVLSCLDIKGCIEWLAVDAMNRLGLDVKTRIDVRFSLASHELQMFVFDAIRELLLNVTKHSKVNTANMRVSLMAKRLMRIQIQDTGIGFDPKQNLKENHIGLFRIQERAESLGGRLEVISHPGKGTCATLILPHRKHHP
jgi:PAS domain S-box-containing protein